MRTLVPELETPRPIGRELPALYQEDAFAQDLSGALDQILAPVFVTLDCLDVYVDPAMAPEDFLDWLATWVGASIDDSWDVATRRAAVANAAAQFRSRGTAGGLAAQLELATGGKVEIVENGATGWSASAGTPLPGQAAPSLRVVVSEGGASADRSSIDRLIQAAKPAHVPHTLEIRGKRT